MPLRARSSTVPRLFTAFFLQLCAPPAERVRRCRHRPLHAARHADVLQRYHAAHYQLGCLLEHWVRPLVVAFVSSVMGMLRRCVAVFKRSVSMRCDSWPDVRITGLHRTRQLRHVSVRLPRDMLTSTLRVQTSRSKRARIRAHAQQQTTAKSVLPAVRPPQCAKTARTS